MKNYKVKAKIVFDDILEKTKRLIGDEFYCSKERYEFLLAHRAVELIEVEEIKEEVKEEVKVEEKKDTSKEVQKKSKPRKKTKLDE